MELNTAVLLGPAGTGKTTQVRAQLESHKLLLTATTGVAAYNLDDTATTINSLMGFFDYASLLEKMANNNWLYYKADQLKDFDGIVMDEASMCEGNTFDALTSVWMKLSQWRVTEGKAPLKILIVGDFLQLPPVGVNPKYAFQASWWENVYQPNTHLLSKIHRQTDPQFQHILSLARRGDGMGAAMAMRAAGVKFTNLPFYNFEGFSLYPTNASVNVHNRTRLAECQGKGFVLLSERWGKQSEDLKQVQDEESFKIGCRVRITANSSFDCPYKFANGQLGTVVDYNPDLGPEILIDGQTDSIILPKVVRFCMLPPAQEHQGIFSKTEFMNRKVFYEYLHDVLIPNRTIPFYDPRDNKVATGAVMYYPMVLGYASTYHKSQGLTLDKVQIDFRQRMAGEAQMMYVALSRCTSLEGLLLCGDPGKLPSRIYTAPAVSRFI